jgi:hypothetical protein
MKEEKTEQTLMALARNIKGLVLGIGKNSF